MSERVVIAEGFEEALRASGLDSFDRVMALEPPEGSVMRAVPGRSTARIEIPGAPPIALYLKRHRGRLRSRAAAREWGMLRDLAAAGIPCPVPVAFGESRGFLSPGEGFLMTREIPGALQGDWWIREHPDHRGELIEGIARLARRFHGAGFHHRDFYLCHFFVREGASGPPGLELFLIDLQRSRRLGLIRRRWIVKDLAQLHFSMGQAGFCPADFRRFLDLYGDLDPALLRSVERKSARIARHVPRYG